MRKWSDQLLKEYSRTNKTATRVINNIHSPKSKPLEMARFSKRERRGIRNYPSCFWLVSWICLPNSSLYSYGRSKFSPLRWPRWPSGLTNKTRPTYINTCAHAHTYTRIYTYVHARTYAHTYILTKCPKVNIWHVSNFWRFWLFPKSHISYYF